MNPDFIPFDSDEDLPSKRNYSSKEDQIYGIFLENPRKAFKTPPNANEQGKKPAKQLDESELTQTYGKGLSLLQKHGYKVGDGLGKNSQGTTQIIGVKIRRKNEGLSFSQPELNPDLRPKEAPGKEDPPSRSQPGKLAKRRKTQDNEKSEEVDKQTTFFEETLDSLDFEEKQIERNIFEIESKQKEINEIIEMIQMFQDLGQSDFPALTVFKDIQKFSVFHDFFLYEGFLVPMFRKVFVRKWEKWKFAGNEMLGFQEVRDWSEVGRVEDIADLWEKAVNSFFASSWAPKEELGESIDALEMWKTAIPEESFSVVTKTVLAKIVKEVEMWDPHAEKIAIHTWVLPWLGLIDLNPVYPKLIHKFELALDRWVAKDRSARLLLKPWKVVLCKFWDDFVVMHVLPKLLFFLKSFQIPEQVKETKSMQCVLDWIGLVPFSHIVEGFKSIFYPKWRKTLEAMLARAEDTEKVYEWVVYWQKKIPEEVLVFEI